ncbi:MAG: hypothetical protein AAGK22_17140 [Acidobacteriota bacterium]
MLSFKTSRFAAALALASLLVLSLSPLQASSRSNAARPVEGRDSASATIVMKAKVTKILEGRRIALQPERKDAPPVEIEVQEDIRIRAQNKKEFDGRKKLGFEDLAVGQTLRITLLPQEERVVSFVVLRGGEWLNT